MLDNKNIQNQAKLFLTGENFYSQEYFGCHEVVSPEQSGFIFRLWAPNALEVSLVGDFIDWNDGIPMEKSIEFGIWEVYSHLPSEGDFYKFKIKQSNGITKYKFDPFAIQFEERPNNAAVVHMLHEKSWKDDAWLKSQRDTNHFTRPINIYEVHASSWKQNNDGTLYFIDQLKKELIPYVVKMGYTHIEFMPLMDHPLGMSWGYQLTGYFAFCSYFGKLEDFQDFVEECHLNNIGVIVDWVPGHFCVNDDALAYYDGTPQFEYEDKDRATNVRWGALNFDLGKPEVQSFLISSALFWIETFHLDGLRVDAVSNMIYRDYDEGEWTVNHEGGNRNYEGYYFLQKLNAVVKLFHPEILMIAEESSSETKVTGPIETGALGFDYKWNLGWMNDTIRFYELDPVDRKANFNLLTFPFMYMMNENYILPFSHDEVVHGKKSLMHKMWGDRYKQFSQLRNLYVYQMTHPGKKLLFMGSEWGQFLEWKYDEGLEWVDLEDSMNRKMQYFTKCLNSLYKEQPSLWEQDFTYETIEIIDADNRDETVLSYIRKGKRKDDFLIIILNMTPIERVDFSVGVPFQGIYTEILNTEMQDYGGTWTKMNEPMITEKIPFKQFQHTVHTIVPALGALIIQPTMIQND